MSQTDAVSRRKVVKWVIAGLASWPLAKFASAAERVDESGPIAQTLKYRHDASQAEGRGEGQFCRNCSFYQGQDGEWGPCLVFSGNEVSSGGWCTSWRAKQG